LFYAHKYMDGEHYKKLEEWFDYQRIYKLIDFYENYELNNKKACLYYIGRHSEKEKASFDKIISIYIYPTPDNKEYNYMTTVYDEFMVDNISIKNAEKIISCVIENLGEI